MKLEVGDIVRASNPLTIFTYRIIRVTKTKAIGKEVNENFEYSFKREYQDNYHIRPWVSQRYDITNRVLIRKNR